MNIKLRAKRVENMLSQAELAKKLHMNTATYNRKEKGITNFTLNEILELLEILNCDFDDIFFRKPVVNNCDSQDK